MSNEERQLIIMQLEGAVAEISRGIAQFEAGDERYVGELGNTLRQMATRADKLAEKVIV